MGAKSVLQINEWLRWVHLLHSQALENTTVNHSARQHPFNACCYQHYRDLLTAATCLGVVTCSRRPEALEAGVAAGASATGVQAAQSLKDKMPRQGVTGAVGPGPAAIQFMCSARLPCRTVLPC